MLMRLRDDQIADADRPALKAFLAERGLQVEPSFETGVIVDAEGRPLAFDGHQTDLTLDPLDKEGTVTGGIFHATLSDAECAFIHGLCVAGGLLVVNPQGEPTYLVPGDSHSPDDVPDADATVWVDNAGQLQAALAGGFEAFQEFRSRVIDP